LDRALQRLKRMIFLAPLNANRPELQRVTAAYEFEREQLAGDASAIEWAALCPFREQ
jgi:hypothetical protein